MSARLKIILIRLKVLLTLSMCALFLSNLLFQSAKLEAIAIALLCLMLLFCLAQIRGVSRIVGYLLFGLSAILLLWHQAPIAVWMEGINRNLYLIVMFCFTPLMTIPLRRGGYNEALQHFLASFLDRKSSFAAFIMSMTAVVGVILNVATVPLMMTLGSQQKEKPDNRLLGSSISRGYSLSLFWGPTFAAVALPLELTGARWVDYFPCALTISLFVLMTSYLFNRFQEERKDPALKHAPKSSLKQKLQTLSALDRNKLKELAIWWIIILGFIVAFSAKTGLNTINVVSIASLTFPILWMFFIHRPGDYKDEFLNNYLKNGLPSMNSEIVLFAGAGLTASAFNYSHAADFIPALLARVTGGNTLLFIILALFIITVISITGIHVMVPVVVLGSTIDPTFYNLSPLAMTFVLTSGWALSIFLSGSTATALLIGNFLHKDSFTVSIGWNWKYGIYMFCLFCVFVYGISRLYSI